MRSKLLAIALTALTALPGSALAWGREGHAVVAQSASVLASCARITPCST